MQAEDKESEEDGRDLKDVASTPGMRRMTEPEKKNTSKIKNKPCRFGSFLPSSNILWRRQRRGRNEFHDIVLLRRLCFVLLLSLGRWVLISVKEWKEVKLSTFDGIADEMTPSGRSSEMFSALSSARKKRKKLELNEEEVSISPSFSQKKQRLRPQTSPGILICRTVTGSFRSRTQTET